jgi:hypothetical protein
MPVFEVQKDFAHISATLRARITQVHQSDPGMANFQSPVATGLSDKLQ